MNAEARAAAEAVRDERPTDRDILVATLNLLACLAEKLTGEKLTVHVGYNGGENHISIFPAHSSLVWVKQAPEGSAAAQETASPKQ